VASTLQGGFRGPLIRQDMTAVWKANDQGIWQQYAEPFPVYESQTRGYGAEVTPEDFAHNPGEFERLLSIGALVEELTEEPEVEPTPMATKPQPPPAKRRMGELLEQLPASVR
jgi:hypothetical protein